MSVMSMKTVLVGDTKEELALVARREREAERLLRIKDPSKCGKVPVEALDAQVAEKAAAAKAAKDLNAAYDSERLYVDQQLSYLEQERRRAEREKLQEVQRFRESLQGRGMAREFDLNNPKGLLEANPARTADDDPRLTVSGMQKFHGEDLTYGHRIKAQRDELRQWCEEAAAAKAEAKRQAQAEEAAFADRLMQIDATKSQMEEAMRQARSSMNRSVAEYNQAQLAAKRERERAQQVLDLQCNVEEIQANLAGTVLTEDPSVGRSYVAPNRLRPDHYKGMSPEEQQHILNEQALQREIKAEAAKAALAEKQASDFTLEQIRLMRCQNETLVAAKRAEMRQEMMEENKRLAVDQGSTKSFLEKTVYQNQIDEGFYSQFNTTSR